MNKDKIIKEISDILSALNNLENNARESDESLSKDINKIWDELDNILIRIEEDNVYEFEKRERDYCHDCNEEKEIINNEYGNKECKECGCFLSVEDNAKNLI